MAVQLNNVDLIRSSNNNVLDVDDTITKVGNIASDIQQAKNDLLGGAGAAYDTLQELATELQDNDSAIATLTTNIGTKLGKTEKAADSEKLDGLDSTAFLRSTAQAADSAKLGGQLPSYYAAAGHGHTEFAPQTGLTATTDGTNALGWTGTQFKVVPVGVSVITKRTGSGGVIEFVFPTS